MKAIHWLLVSLALLVTAPAIASTVYEGNGYVMKNDTLYSATKSITHNHVVYDHLMGNVPAALLTTKERRDMAFEVATGVKGSIQIQTFSHRDVTGFNPLLLKDEGKDIWNQVTYTRPDKGTWPQTPAIVPKSQKYQAETIMFYLTILAFLGMAFIPVFNFDKEGKGPNMHGTIGKLTGTTVTLFGGYLLIGPLLHSLNESIAASNPALQPYFGFVVMALLAIGITYVGLKMTAVIFSGYEAAARKRAASLSVAAFAITFLAGGYFLGDSALSVQWAYGGWLAVFLVISIGIALTAASLLKAHKEKNPLGQARDAMAAKANRTREVAGSIRDAFRDNTSTT